VLQLPLHRVGVPSPDRSRPALFRC